MAATNAAALSSASVAPTSAEPATRSRLSAALLLCRFWTLAAALLALGSLPDSSWFTVREIQVDGARHLPPAAIVARSGLSIGQSITAVDPADVARRVAGHPRVSAAAVVVAGGRVTIRVTERTPAAALAAGGRYAIVDASGIVVGEQLDPGALPVVAVEAADLPWVRIGTAVPAAVPQAIDALSLLPSAMPRAGLTMRRASNGDLSLLTPDRIVVRLGGADGLRERAAVLPEILATVRAQRLVLDYVDIRFAGNVILKPAAGAGAGAGAAGAGVRP